MKQHRLSLIAIATVAAWTAQAASAQTATVISDTLTGASSSYNWLSLGGACLTAGNGTGSIPACVGNSYYATLGSTLVGGATGTLPDLVGSGALRLTNGATNTGSNSHDQVGAVVSNFTFPSSQGVNVTFTTVTYGGNNGNNTGADGLSFFLLDNSVNPAPPASGSPNPSTNNFSMLGVPGGSLGYSCSNYKTAPATVDGSGILGGYLGIGIDEYGNFVNGASGGSVNDNTATTGPALWGTSVSNANTSAGAKPGNISVRGAGNVNWTTLKNNAYYTNPPSALTAVENTCSSGFLYNYTGAQIKDRNGSTINKGNPTTEKVADYPLLGSSLLPSNQPISSQQATANPNRNAAIPVTYQLNITQNGRLTVQYSYNGLPAQTVISNQNLTTVNGALPPYVRFGFAASTGGASNVHEITCFKAQSSVISSSSAGSNTQQLTPISGGSQVYLALNNPLGSWGQLTANTLKVDANGNGSIAATANWDASCVLTGTPLYKATGGTGSTAICPATGQALGAAEPIASSGAASGRNLLTWSGSAGIPLTWTTSGSPATGSPLLALTAGDATPLSGNRLNYLRGDRTNEITTANPTAPFRRRISVLGDIMNSSPTWVGAPSQAAYYGGPWKDKINASDPLTENSNATGYKGFASTNATRTNVVYAGANDGFLHAFRAGSFDANGNWASLPGGTGTGALNDGYELLGYMPSSALATIHGNSTSASTTGSTINPSLDFSSPSYAHAYFVDATPATNDLYYNGAWHTWLVGGMGAGGNYGGPVNSNSANNNSITATGSGTTQLGAGAGGAIYALDITNPSNFSETNAGSLVMGDWNASNLICASITGTRTGVTTATCGKNLGNTFGTPVIRRLHDGNWAIIFGNGLNSSTGAAGIYVMTIPQGTSSSTTLPVPVIRFIDTGLGTTTNKDGIVQVTAADIDGDSITDYVYAGDVLGNVWRFDLTNSAPASWSASASPMFTTPAGQPITTALAVTPVAASTGNPRMMVDFGTGQQFPMTAANGSVTYATTQQALYGIWDWNMSAWNAKGSSQYAVPPGTVTPPTTLAAANLQTQTMTVGSITTTDGKATRSMTQNAVCWVGTTTCTGTNNQYGWTSNLSSVTTGSGAGKVTNYEQIVFNPQINFGDFLVNTTIPGTGGALTCNTVALSGYSMAITPDAGAAPSTSFFTGTAVNVAGVAIGAVGTAFFVTDNKGNNYMVNQTAVADPNTKQFGDIRNVYPVSGYTGKRLNWIKQR